MSTEAQPAVPHMYLNYLVIQRRLAQRPIKTEMDFTDPSVTFLCIQHQEYLQTTIHVVPDGQGSKKIHTLQTK